MTGREDLTLGSPDRKKSRVVRFKTAMGSIYEYLPDGRTQRFKTVENDRKKPMDQIVFIPPWDVIKDEARKNYPKIFQGIEGEGLYESLLLEYIHDRNKTIRITDNKGKELSNNQEIQATEHALIFCLDKSNPENSFYLRVSKEPRVGFLTFDTSKYKGSDGKTYRDKHIGNKVIDIEYSQ